MRAFRNALPLIACLLLLAIVAVDARSALPPGYWTLGAIPAAAEAKPAEHVPLPELSAVYRMTVTREAQAVWGLDAPVARIAGQIHQESHWQATAKSPYAQGLMQFVPSTATWLAGEVDECNPADPWDPNWSIRCGIRYDAWLLARSPGATECDRWAFALAAYNGGWGWTQRDRRTARATGVSDQAWFGAVEVTPDTRRAPENIGQNRDYVRVILLRWEPAYIAAGWPGQAACS